MEKYGASRAMAYRRLKAKHGGQLGKMARSGNGHDHLDQHPDGYHPTPPYGTRALLAFERFESVICEPACGDGAMSRILEAAGHTVIGTGFGRGGHDFLTDHTTYAGSHRDEPDV